MNDELMAIDKKIQSTEEELTRLKRQLNPNSSEYVFSSAVLVKRLLELKEQKREIEKGLQAADEVVKAASPSSELPEKSVEPLPLPEKKREKLILVLSGTGIGQGSISIRVLSSVLHHLQNLTDQIAHSVYAGPILSDQIPNHILRQSDLTVRHTFPGSFGIELEAAIEPSQHWEEPLLSQSLSTLFDLLQSVNHPGRLLEHFAYLGPQSLAVYRQWMSFMADQGIMLRCEWKHSDGQLTSWAVDHESLPGMVKTLEKIRVDRTKEMEILGSFVGMNIRDHTFELMNLETFEVITGQSQREVLMKSRQWLGEEGRMKMLKCVAQDMATGEEKILWYLQEVNPMTTG